MTVASSELAECPPVLFIIFKRPETTREVMEAIRKAQPSRLYVAADGPRANRPGEAEACDATRKIATAVDWPCQVFTLLRKENLGCKLGVSTAIDWFFEHEPEGIILEDDVVPNQSFFFFCAELLNRYRNDTRIGMIGGANFQMGVKRGEDSYYFSRLYHVWGWASWRRAWQKYDREMRSWPLFKKIDGFSQMGLSGALKAHYFNPLEDVSAGKIDTWDYQWVFSCLSQNMLSIIPQENMISNIGFGANATHTMNAKSPQSRLQTQQMSFPLSHPAICIANMDADLATVNLERPSLPVRLRSAIGRKLKLRQ